MMKTHGRALQPERWALQEIGGVCRVIFKSRAEGLPLRTRCEPAQRVAMCLFANERLVRHRPARDWPSHTRHFARHLVRAARRRRGKAADHHHRPCR